MREPPDSWRGLVAWILVFAAGTTTVTALLATLARYAADAGLPVPTWLTVTMAIFLSCASFGAASMVERYVNWRVWAGTPVALYRRPSSTARGKGPR